MVIIYQRWHTLFLSVIKKIISLYGYHLTALKNNSAFDCRDLGGVSLKCLPYLLSTVTVTPDNLKACTWVGLYTPQIYVENTLTQARGLQL
jgi:hypothetical protein